MKTLEELLAPVSEAAPCGEDLDESVEFDNLRMAFEVNFPIDTGVSPLGEGDAPPPPVKWFDTLEKIETLTESTKDLFLAVSYARCGLVLADAEVVDRGLQFTAALLEDHWEMVHPAIDGPLGIGGRAMIFEDLARRGAFAMPLLELPVIDTGRVTVKVAHLLDADEHGGASDNYAEVMRTVESLDDEARQQVLGLFDRFRSSIDRIAAAFQQNGSGNLPNFETLLDTIDMGRGAFARLAGLESADEDGAADEGESAAADGGFAGDVGGGSGAGFSGAVKSRDDVLRALAAIEQYYARAEPGHPLRLAMGRLRSWVGKDFMAILEDIAPRSLDEAKSVLLERHDVE